MHHFPERVVNQIITIVKELIGPSRPHSPARLGPCLEALETRLAPANVFVVPISQPVDATHLHTLNGAISGAGENGRVTIEPGSSPEPSSNPTIVNKVFLTIQGDPDVPASILPALHLDVVAGDVTLTNLNIESVIVGSQTDLIAPFTHVNNCLIRSLGVFIDAKSTYTQNIITGGMSIVSDGHFGGDLIDNNTFTTAATFPLSLNAVPGAMVTRNVFFVEPNVEDALNVHNCGALDGAPTTIANNTITAAGMAATGIFVHQDGTGVSDVKIVNNTIETKNFGLSLAMAIGDNDHFRAYVEGNDFHNNAVGVLVQGDQTAAGNIDLGHGALGSQGGNNFRGFTAPADFNHAAILLESAPHGGVAAGLNIFPSPNAPDTFVKAVTGSILVDSALDSDHAFVQSLFNEVLGRTGTAAEIESWVQFFELHQRNQQLVVNGIVGSPEALGRVVDALYLRFLGRPSDTSGRNGWINFLQHGGTLEALDVFFLTAPEYVSHINTDYVQSLYVNVLGRTANLEEVLFWNNQIQALGLAGIANAFVRSTENRLNTLRSDFQMFLHRTPGDAELTPLVNTSLDVPALERTVLSSSEFFANG
jgi:hypothetical protein